MNMIIKGVVAGFLAYFGYLGVSHLINPKSSIPAVSDNSNIPTFAGVGSTTPTATPTHNTYNIEVQAPIIPKPATSTLTKTNNAQSKKEKVVNNTKPLPLRPKYTPTSPNDLNRFGIDTTSRATWDRFTQQSRPITKKEVQLQGALSVFSSPLDSYFTNQYFGGSGNVI